MSPKLRLWVPVLFGVSISIGLIGILEEPACALLVTWIGVSALRVFGVGSPDRRALWFNFAIAMFVLGGGVAFLSGGPVIRVEASSSQWTVDHDLLGYAPAPSLQTRIRRYEDEELVFDVTYTMNEHGLRVGPPRVENPDNECILFFGGSFMFGEGLEDAETLPYRMGIESGGRFEIHNFGFSGYGPHQMLAALELGLVDSVVDCQPRYVIYQAGYFHIPRASGLSSWDARGPYFALVEEGRVEYRGRFDQADVPKGWFARLVSASGIEEIIPGLHRPPDGDDYDVFIGILENARRYVASHYPSAEFHVIFWDQRRPGLFPLYLFDWSRPPLTDSLLERGVNLIRVTQALPGMAENPEMYMIPGDGHPNAMAQARIASHLVQRLGEASETRLPGLSSQFKEPNRQ